MSREETAVYRLPVSTARLLEDELPQLQRKVP